MRLAVARSSLAASLTRYSRSWGLWLLLMAGPVGARFMIARDDGTGVQIAVGQHLPVMTSAVLGVSLGIVVSTLLLPIGFLYLRSNAVRRQPWQVEEVTPASRVAIACGRAAADMTVLFGMLAALTAAGWFLGWLIVTGPFDPLEIAWTLWLVAAPALMMLAAIHRLLDAWPATRGGMGELAFFMLWIASLALPVAVSRLPSSLGTNLYDLAGFVRPLAGPSPAAARDIAIGGTDIRPGRVPLDVIAGIEAPGYVAARLVWAVAAVMVTVLAGLLYRPHVQPRRRRWRGRAARLLSPGPPPPVRIGTPPAPAVAWPPVWLAVAEFRLIGAGRLFRLLALAAAILGMLGDYRHVGSPAALLLLIGGLAAHAGRSEAKGLSPLALTTAQSPWARRSAFVVAGMAWALALAAPAALVRASAEPLMLAAGTGIVATVIAALLAAIGRSGFAPRLVLIVLWYAYLSA